MFEIKSLKMVTFSLFNYVIFISRGIFMKIKSILFVLPMVTCLAACGNPSGGGSNTKPESKGNILHGKGAPSKDLGEDFSHYYDEESHLVYEKNGGEWINQLTYGAPSLYSEKNTQLKKLDRRVGVSSADHQKIKDALMMSFYSTNITFTMTNTSREANQYLYKIDKRNISMHMESGDYQETYYSNIDEEGAPYTYQGGKYVKEIWGEMSYVALPHPTIENIAYTNFLFYDDNYGQQTSIVCANLDKLSYDSETKQYTVSNIHVSHGPMTTKLVHEPTAGEFDFDFIFTLSSDETYVDYAHVKYPATSTWDSFEYHFSDVHTTSIEMPA